MLIHAWTRPNEQSDLLGLIEIYTHLHAPSFKLEINTFLLTYLR